MDPAVRPTPPPTTVLCLDSSVVCTLLLQERGWQAIYHALQRPEVEGIMPGPALTESIRVSRR
jgi:hypothetical protein